jgi:hypothetical protein
MQTKLTLRLDDALIRRAKRHAATSGRSVSQLVADYFALIDAGDEASGVELTPRVRALLGTLPGDVSDADAYRRHLESKHR